MFQRKVHGIIISARMPLIAGGKFKQCEEFVIEISHSKWYSAEEEKRSNEKVELNMEKIPKVR